MFVHRLRVLAQVIGFVVMGLLMISGAVSFFQYADHALGAPAQVEHQVAAAAPLQQQQTSVPQILNYAGELRNTAGELMSGTYTMTFRIYSAKAADPSQALWSEVRSGIKVQNGRFGLVLGERNPLSPAVFNGSERYFGLSVESEDGGSPISEDTPSLRKRFAMVPFAAQAGYASALMAADGDPLDSVYVNTDGNVGIGTTLPGEKLEINQGGNLLFKAVDQDAGDILFQNSAGMQKGRIWSSGVPDPALFLSSGDNFPDITLDVGGNVGIGTVAPSAKLDVRGYLTLEAGNHPRIYGGTGNQEWNRYLLLLNSPDAPTTLGLNAGGVLVSDDYGFASPGKNDLIVKGSVGIGTSDPQATLHVNGEIRGKLQYTDEFIWNQGDSFVTLIHKDLGFCFLTYVSGAFAGGGENVFVQIQDDFWVLGGNSMQIDVSAKARCAGVE